MLKAQSSSSSSPSSTYELQQIEALIRNGGNQAAADRLKAVLKTDRTNAGAWYLMAQVIEPAQRRRDCLEQVLRYDPSHVAARRELARLDTDAKAKDGTLELPDLDFGAQNPLSTPPRTAQKVTVRTTPQTDNSPVLLQADDLHKTLQSGAVKVEALRGVSLTIRQGEMIWIVGQSGSGKSTLLGLLGGLDKPTKGRVLLGDTDLTTLKERPLTRLRSEKIGFVFQSFNLIPTLTAIENVAIPAVFSSGKSSGKATGKNVQSRARELLARFGLENRLRHYPAQLSGGEQQRVAIARALINTPSLVLADEPTGNLDSHSAAIVLDALEDARTHLAAAVVIVTHSADIAARADRLITLADGQIVHDQADNGRGWTS